MASTLKYITTYEHLQYAIKERNDLAELSKPKKYVAARKIQAWVRGLITRNHLRMLHEKATIIQRNWRGHRVRSRADDYLIERVEEMWRNHYDRMATRIQAAWRGYRARKTGVDFRKMRQWLSTVYTKNWELLEEMNKFREKEMERVQNTVEEESMRSILHILFKLHHLLRTKHRPGVITRIDEKHSTSIEEMLRCLEYEFYVTPKRAACEVTEIPSTTALVFRGTRLERCEREIREFQKDLREGRVPVYRSEPYEQQELERKETIRLVQKIAQDRKGQPAHSLGIRSKTRAIGKRSPGCTGSNGTSRESPGKSKCPFAKTNLQCSCLDPSEIYDMLRQMDCQLNKADRPRNNLNLTYSYT